MQSMRLQEFKYILCIFQFHMLDAEPFTCFVLSRIISKYFTIHDKLLARLYPYTHESSEWPLLASLKTYP